MKTPHRLKLFVAAVCFAGLPGCHLTEKWGSGQSLADRQALHSGRPQDEGGSKTAALSPVQTAEVQVALGRVLEKRGEEKAAAQAYLAALQHDPNRADAHWRLAVLHSQQGDFNSATQCFQKALQKEPRNPEIYCDLGYCQYTQNRWNDAEQSFRQAAELDPRNGRAHNNLGLLLARTNRVQESLAEFAAAGCNPAEAYENIAFALTLEQRLPEAHQYCQAALAHDPASKSAQKLNSTLIARLTPAAGHNSTGGFDPSMAGTGHGPYGSIQPAAYFPDTR